MSAKTWATKEEVLEDLAMASGRKIRKVDLNNYLVIGDGPPPVLSEDTEDEMAFLFGDDIHVKGEESEVTPDLTGITEMLRMVQDFGTDDTSTNDAIGCPIQISKPKSKVSKLNPHVEEFIPKTKKCNISSKETSKNINNNNITQLQDVAEDKTKDANVKSDVSEYQNIANKLKNTISDAAKSDSFDDKKQKNVAIATLLRLYAKKSEPVKLITPEYFEHGPTDTPVKPETSTNARINTTPPSSSPSSSEVNLKEPKLDPEIKKSIDKVNKWLDQPTKRRSPAVCLGPISFKRKETVGATSPVSDPGRKETKPASSGQQYVPSDYAADLGRKYMERYKESEEKKNAVTWTNLDTILKEKDKEIKKRLEEQASSSNSSSPHH